jgi:hypothetical protein
MGTYWLQLVGSQLRHRSLRRRSVGSLLSSTAHELNSISGLVCTDAGLNGNAIVSEYGYANFGAQYGGLRTSWDLSHVGLAVNLPTQLSSSDGQTVTCTSSGCAANQAYNSPTDYAADRNSPLGQTYTHTFCP